MNLASIPPGLPFLDTVARRWLDLPDPADGLLILPTRRAARALADSFLAVSAGRPMLLPRIIAVGALDEAPLALAGALDLPPPIEEQERLALLAGLILRRGDMAGMDLDRAWPLATALADLIDEAARAEIDLRAALPGAVDAAHAEHWQRTLDFLAIITEHWPAILRERGRSDPVAHQVALLDAQTRAWTDAAGNGTAGRVWAAGLTGAIPAVARLLRAVARLPSGLVLLPGLDHALPEAVWADPDPNRGLGAAHPQSSLRDLLARVGARRADVVPWTEPTAKASTVAAALHPEALIDERWGEGGAPAGLFRLTTEDARHEAVAIAMILRETLETPGARAALVTPDRDLAARVAAELERFGIVADDSAGEMLAETPPGTFLRLLARALADGLAPVPLLALLKHPLAAAGLSPARARNAARCLERAALRGPRPSRDGLAGLRAAVGEKDREAADFVSRLERCLSAALRAHADDHATATDRLTGLLAAAETLAGTDEASGAARLWGGEEGGALAERLSVVLDALATLDRHPMRADALPGFLDAILAGASVRSRRALRGRDAVAEHPRVFIWGLLEARLQQAETVVLGGLAEDVWPPAADPGPWLSRPMRRAIGLPSPEETVGQGAHDFLMAACAGDRTVLSCPRRRDGAPTVPSRFLARLTAMMAGNGTTLPDHPAASWAAQLDRATTPHPAPPPRPTPPAHLRPTRLSVSDIRTLVQDPYAIYASKILRLERLDAIDDDQEALTFGNIVHEALATFVGREGARVPDAAAALLRADFARTLGRSPIRAALLAWWRPRLDALADWLAGTLRDRAATTVASEIEGLWTLDGRLAGTVIKARADRIETRADGMLAIIDYKTGTVPKVAAIEAGHAPQLSLEAVMAEAGCFPGVTGTVGEIAHWKLSGGHAGGVIDAYKPKESGRLRDLIAGARTGVVDLLERYAWNDTPYLSMPDPGAVARESDYAQLARVGEWSVLAGDRDD